MSLVRTARTLVGLDMGTSSAEAVELAKGNRGYQVSVVWESLGSDAVMDWASMNFQGVAEAIKKTLAAERSKPKGDGHSVIVKRGVQPAATAAEDDASEADDPGMEVLFVAVKRGRIRNNASVVNLSGCNVDIVDSEGFDRKAPATTVRPLRSNRFAFTGRSDSRKLLMVVYYEIFALVEKLECCEAISKTEAFHMLRSILIRSGIDQRETTYGFLLTEQSCVDGGHKGAARQHVSIDIGGYVSPLVHPQSRGEILRLWRLRAVFRILTACIRELKNLSEMRALAWHDCEVAVNGIPVGSATPSRFGSQHNTVPSHMQWRPRIDRQRHSSASWLSFGGISSYFCGADRCRRARRRAGSDASANGNQSSVGACSEIPCSSWIGTPPGDASPTKWATEMTQCLARLRRVLVTYLERYLGSTRESQGHVCACPSYSA